MPESLWSRCARQLADELPEQDFNTWIRPLQAVEEEGELRLLAPNRFVVAWLEQHVAERIQSTLDGMDPQAVVRIEVGTRAASARQADDGPDEVPARARPAAPRPPPVGGRLNPDFTFTGFVEGNSNHIARAAAFHVASNPGQPGYNPLFIAGGVGLGKTHLMQAIGNQIVADNPGARVSYVHSERFVGEMVRALQHNTMEQFKRAYRELNALLIDDIQFFAKKDRTQEEFFHTFNALFEAQQQIVLTCDSFPREVEGLEERLKSRFGWGLVVGIEPPELETSVAILMKKAAMDDMRLPEEVAFFIAKHIRPNVRELEGALRRVIAHSRFTGAPIGMDLTREALRDLLAMRARLVTIENIQKTVAEYFKIRVADLLSKRRSRAVTRPRQIAMSLAKELTRHSLPEIGDAFGGRDHTTVLHACKRVKELRDSDSRINEDYVNLLRTLTA